MPIRPADIGGSSMGLNPFGAHIGNHGIDGHPGWDIEYRIGASVYAAADGVVQSVATTSDGAKTVQIQHSTRFRTDYVGLGEVDAAIVAGAPVKAGQRLGLPAVTTLMVGTVTKTWAAIHFQLDDFTVNHGLSNGFAVSPEAHLDADGRAVFEELWSRAAYFPEICEPFASNPRTVRFPFTRTWTRQTGGRVDFTCAGPASAAYGYAWHDAAGALVERGSMQPQSAGPEGTTFDLLPDSGPPRRRGLLRIVGDTMQAEGFGAASVFRTAGYPLAVTSGASYAAGKVAPDSVAAAFGAGLAVQTASAPGETALPTTLGGTRVMARDSAGVPRNAGLYYVTPGQVGFVIPADSATGPGSVIVTSPDGPVYTAAVDVVPVVPALFAADATGRGLAAANVLRVRADGGRSVEPVTLPIDFGAAGDQIFLILYGTGIRRLLETSGVTVRVGALELPAAFAGPHPLYPAVDQVNVALPRSLSGQGQVPLAVNVSGAASNGLHVTFR
jgi:uncharacterized protein (TIGR03437 family)